MATNRDDFPSKIVEILKKRAAFICSNPSCKKMTVAPSEADDEKILYFGKAAHICAAAKGGPRYDSNMTEHQRSSIENAIFLCSNCADMIDDNQGIDFPVQLLKEWKREHEKWIRDQLNKSMEKSEERRTIITVSSTNQTGGITAGIVNFEKPARHINEKLRQELLSNFPDPNEKIEISATMGNVEAYSFAEEIRQHLIERGFTIESVGQIMIHPIVIGLRIQQGKDGRHLIIGAPK